MSKDTKPVFIIVIILIMMTTVVSFNSVETYAAKLDTKAKIQLRGANQPTLITQGSSFLIKGKMVSNKKMKRVEVGIVYASTNKWTKYKYDNKKVKAKSFDLKRASSKLKFNKLSIGDYYYRIYAHTSDGVVIVLNKKFTVKKAPAKPSVYKVVVKIFNTITGKAQGNVVLSSYNYPIKYTVGSKYTLKGTITSDTIIKRIEIGIVVSATNKWTEYKYDNAAVNAKTFDISKVASTLSFDKLPGGTFAYRIYVHTKYGVVTVLNKSFEVKPSNKPKEAIRWASAIASNNKYTYGKGYGGYFTCPVCAKKTASKADTQFTCMPFLAAAYAHGTNNQKLINNGRHIMNLNNDNFKGSLGEAWFKVGLCKDLKIEDLQPGDVIIKWSDNNDSGHAWMYGGGDSIIEAVPSDVRRLNTGAAAKLRRYGHSEGIPSKNYVMRYRG